MGVSKIQDFGNFDLSPMIDTVTRNFNSRQVMKQPIQPALSQMMAGLLMMIKTLIRVKEMTHNKVACPAVKLMMMKTTLMCLTWKQMKESHRE